MARDISTHWHYQSYYHNDLSMIIAAHAAGDLIGSLK